ncbi:acireductone synthase [Sphingosinicella microcystinivorans]|uniref:Enolase-phosphatase E1 n=1 Tax=Sphingosinicella microcystinivorans TaxID=335406 RepID=A0AAD1FZA9_SPHMI|nr:acireductone synthase [Sphingosinicella microcystinivorans]RKS88957.1 acireductone synthase [Sphingosinicella microcystinivorans]BBE32712.1 enolase-phosphatase E1 [Sphingosinicella microcystinivorans]
MVKAILTDIEGTTSSIAFVTDTLFPYARARLADWIAAHAHEAAPILKDVPGDPVETLTRWIDEDRKETALKTLQGLIWAEGYADGTLKGHVYPDAAEALRRWHAEGIGLYVYSSGSVAAQKLIFGYSNAGDLTPLFSGYFDTTTGPKKEAASYRRIAADIGLPVQEILFLSDSVPEIEAARAAGFKTYLVDRETGAGDVASFAEIAL